MTLIVREFQLYDLSEERLTYFEINKYVQKDFKEFLVMDKTVDAALGHMWYEYEPAMKDSEIECFMIYVVMLKLYVSQNQPYSELRDEVKRMVSAGILEKYQPQLPADEYQLLADDVKALQLVP